jgi:NitT/TauT family transport system permease protein
MRVAQILPLTGSVAAAVALAGAFSSKLPVDQPAWRLVLATLMLALATGALLRLTGRLAVPLILAAGLVAGAGIALVALLSHGVEGRAQWPYWTACIAVWLAAWQLVEALVCAKSAGWRHSLLNLAVPVLFGATLLFLWETIVRGAGVPHVILPAPTAIAGRLFNSLPVLAADFVQTFHGVAAGYGLGCGAGFLGAVLIDRIGFLQRGLLPLGNLVSALPIVGIAPIMVMWFGFDWPSKAAVVVTMTFFPMLVNTVAGLAATGSMERDLMKTYGASYGQTLFRLRLPAALPFVFNGLKINSTLALIGAIVAEFFGTPIVGMGFRINTEVGRMNIDMVWATIVVAALAGSLFYGLLALIERQVTFWHASYRQRPA